MANFTQALFGVPGPGPTDPGFYDWLSSPQAGAFYFTIVALYLVSSLILGAVETFEFVTDTILSAEFLGAPVRLWLGILCYTVAFAAVMMILLAELIPKDKPTSRGLPTTANVSDEFGDWVRDNRKKLLASAGTCVLLGILVG